MLFYPVLLLGSVLFLDICLSGDNAVVIAMAANGIRKDFRDAAIFLGMAFACALRIIFATVANTLLLNPWIGITGGLILFWVAYKLLMQQVKFKVSHEALPQTTNVRTAIITIVAADVSMSLDNILAVAALARHHVFIMAIGILFSIVILTFLARRVADLLQRHSWLNWVGLGLILWVAVDLVAGSYNAVLTIMRQ